MWSLIGNALGLVRETITRRFKTKHERTWKENEVDIKEALANRDVHSIASIFKRLRRKGSSSERR
jgi:hypothetical protein|tara:strand:- start:2564 stop:2758 length:195 start_codon:yes stop_codon:yes gene_type:complete